MRREKEKLKLFLSLCQMASLYKDRLNKLVYGYNRKITDTPMEISMCILAYADVKCKLIVNEIASRIEVAGNIGPGMKLREIHTMEIYLDEFAARIIDYNHDTSIDHYQVEYESTSNDNDDIMKTQINQIEERGLAFIEIKLEEPITFPSRLQAVNSNKECIMTIEWKKFGGHIQTNEYNVRISRDVAYKYFKRFGQKHVDINKWIVTLSEMEDFKKFGVWEMKRIFYFTMYLKEKGILDSGEEMRRMQKTDFHTLLCFHFNNYTYNEFVNIFIEQMVRDFGEVFEHNIDFIW